MKKTQNLTFLSILEIKIFADEKKDDFMDTHQYISECLTNLVFSQIARKCDNSSRDLNRDLNLNLNLKPHTYYYDGLAEQPSDIRWLRGPRTSFFSKLPGFRNRFRNFQQQMFLANNMIHQRCKVLKLALPCCVKFMSPYAPPPIRPTDDSYLSVAMQSYLLVKFEGYEFYH